MGMGSSTAKMIGAFLPKKVKTLYYSKPLKNTTENFMQWLEDSRTSGEGQIKAFQDAINAAFPVSQEMGREDAATLGGFIDQAKGYDPYSGYERMRSGNLGGLGGFLEKFIPQVAQGGASQADKMRLALGGGGGRGGAYADKLAMNTMSSAIAPGAMNVLNTIYSKLGGDYGTAEGNRWTNLLSGINLMGERAQTPYRGTYQLLDPALARNEIMGSQISQLGSLADTTRKNVMGSQIKGNPWGEALKAAGEEFDRQDAQIKQVAGKVLSMYGGGALGGMGGALGGALSSGGGGGGGGGGGMSQEQFQQLLQAIQNQGGSGQMFTNGNANF